MDKELFKKTEGRLYRYFKSKNIIHSLNSHILDLENRQKTIEHDIKNANVTIDYYQNGSGIQERVQTSPTGTGYAESEMCKEIGKLEKEHLLVTKKIFKDKAKIRELESFVEHMNRNIGQGQLQEEDIRFIELKYGDKKSIISISMKLNIAQATAYRKREEIVSVIAEYDNTLLNKC